MRGHKPLIELRRQGVCPSVIFVDVGHDLLQCSKDWHIDMQDFPHINITGDDDIATLDLRFLVGCTVLITQLEPASAQRVQAIAKRLREDLGARVTVELA